MRKFLNRIHNSALISTESLLYFPRDCSTLDKFCSTTGYSNTELIITMKNNIELYEAPTITVVEMKQEGVICASGLTKPSDYPGALDPFGN